MRARQAKKGGWPISVKDEISRDWSDHYWWSADGVRLHARVYDGPEEAAAAPPILCMPGLARNVRDFEDLAPHVRSEEHTSELQSLMRISYAVFCLKKKKHIK